MEDCRTSLLAYLPSAVSGAVRALPPSLFDEIQEIRLRRNAPLTLSTATKTIPLSVIVTAADVQDCFLRLCDHAVHTHQAELAQGFVTTKDGFRAGVAGSAVLREGEVISYRDIRSLCIRLSRRIDGCADPLLLYVDDPNGINSLLLCGAPACGKTTLLRDLSRSLSASRRICIVDERRELLLGDLPFCDVLSGCPKAVGILQAVRTLSPDAVIVDELGDEKEWQAVEQSCYLGVPIIASVHLRTPEELFARDVPMRLLRNGGFSLVAFLPPRDRFSAPARIWKARDLLENTGDCFDRVFLRGGRDHRSVASAKR